MSTNAKFYPIKGGISPGHITEVSGNVPADASRIDIALVLVNHAGVPIGEAILCSFRFAERLLVMNSKLDGTYGPEEKVENPFSSLDSVVLQLSCTETGFNVICNEMLVHQYAHRVKSFDRINQLSVSGDLVVTNVKP